MRYLVAVLVLLPALCLSAQIVHTIDAPDSGISGLAYGAGSLWAVDGTTAYIYELDPSSGSVLNSWHFPSGDPAGLTFCSNTIFVSRINGGTYEGYVYKYSTSGSSQGSFDSTC